jgi:large subunit ribosomal protein L23
MKYHLKQYRSFIVSNIKTLSPKCFRTFLKSVKYPLITDKSTQLLNRNKYTFIVDKKVNKLAIKNIIEYLFNVNVCNVNTLILNKKKRTVGRFVGYTARYKKAIITVKAEDRINIFSDI